MTATPALPASAIGLSPEQRQFIAVLARIALRIARQQATETTIPPGAASAPNAAAIAH